MGAIISLSQPVSVEYGSFDNALQTGDFNPMGDQLEHKWYAAGVGVVREAVVGSDGSARLVAVSHAQDQINLNSRCGRDGGVAFVGAIPVRDARAGNLDRLARISAQEAAEAAQAVTGAASGNSRLAVVQGFLVYTVPLRGGVAIVDAGDGAVLAVTTQANAGDD
jgi:hypothetical protein